MGCDIWEKSGEPYLVALVAQEHPRGVVGAIADLASDITLTVRAAPRAALHVLRLRGGLELVVGALVVHGTLGSAALAAAAARLCSGSRRRHRRSRKAPDPPRFLPLHPTRFLLTKAIDSHLQARSARHHGRVFLEIVRATSRLLRAAH